MKIKLQPVQYMPKELKPGVLYVSEEFGTAAHLCPCGCGSKIRTPIGPTEWSIKVTDSGPTLYPSVGNWQQACQSHYWIWHGSIRWADQWTPEQIAQGRSREQEKRHAYYGEPNHQPKGILEKLWVWLLAFFK